MNFKLNLRYVKGKWWRTQYRGFVGFYAAFLGLNSQLFDQVGVIGNAGARKIGNLISLNNSSHQLRDIKSRYNICVQRFFVKTIVSWVGHCFRHPNHPISSLLSLPLDGRLTELRLLSGRSLVSEASLRVSELFSQLGVMVDPERSGPLNIRTHSGRALGWGHGWSGSEAPKRG